MRTRFSAAAVLLCSSIFAQSQFLPGTRPFINVDAPVIALEHARIIDGTGAAVAEDQTIVIDHGRIQAVGRAGQVAVPSDARRIDLNGKTVIPGLVGMHEHLFYRPAAASRCTSSRP